MLLFLFAELLSFSLLIQYNSFHRANFLGWTNEITGGTYNLLSEATEYISLKEVNEQLSRENARLKAGQINAYRSLTPGVVFVNDSAYELQYEFLESKVVQSTTAKRNNYLTLNSGDDMSIQPQMGVISPEGVVGIIKGTSENYASVISLLHKDFKVSAKLKTSDYFGILSWNGRDHRIAQLQDIPSHVAVEPGDTVVTRGSGTVFPPDVLIGTISSIKPIDGTDFLEIDVRLSVDFRRVNFVYVVRNKMKMEQLELEELNESDEDDQ